jgi:hypothetical protein
VHVFDHYFGFFEGWGRQVNDLTMPTARPNRNGERLGIAEVRILREFFGQPSVDGIQLRVEGTPMSLLRLVR